MITYFSLLISRPVIVLFSCLLFTTTALCQENTQQKIKVAVPNFPPFTYQENKQITGKGIELAKKVFAKADIQASFQLLPNYGKVVQHVKDGKADIFLLASQNSERDKIAVFTNPLMVNRWQWYLLKSSNLDPQDKSFKSNATISTHFNTNTHKWLQANGYKVQAAMQVNQLPQMLIAKRVDAIFIAEQVFLQAIDDAGIDLGLFKIVTEQEKPFGMYVSNRLADKNLTLVNKINQAIGITVASK